MRIVSKLQQQLLSLQFEHLGNVHHATNASANEPAVNTADVGPVSQKSAVNVTTDSQSEQIVATVSTAEVGSVSQVSAANTSDERQLEQIVATVSTAEVRPVSEVPAGDASKVSPDDEVTEISTAEDYPVEASSDNIVEKAGSSTAEVGPVSQISTVNTLEDSRLEQIAAAVSTAEVGSVSQVQPTRLMTVNSSK
jgi:hypothetical protein